ncbi:hypothetical protein OTK59_17580 [Vibrio natriegens]|uniref:hypothetical protein n=1 Tax=Vibrio natriegens TaxID=691 RepID=UPI002285383A|nr:hypothetical protein [Vibrio natriegens]MCY9878374.1 hypothetical protein [Vibrio natriegens]
MYLYKNHYSVYYGRVCAPKRLVAHGFPFDIKNERAGNLALWVLVTMPPWFSKLGLIKALTMSLDPKVKLGLEKSLGEHTFGPFQYIEVVGTAKLLANNTVTTLVFRHIQS